MIKRKVNNSIVLICVLLIGLNTVAYAQKKSRALLEKEKTENQKRIEEANKILLETRTRKEATIGQLSAIKSKINSRERLIESIADEVGLLESEINELNQKILGLQTKIDTLKSEYADMVRAASRLNSNVGKLTYILSSESISQFAMRVKYFQHYSEIRKAQLGKIESTIAQVQKEKQKILQKVSAKNKLINVKTQETQSLQKEKEEQNDMLSNLSSKEKELKSELEDRKKSQKKLEKLIVEMIAAERERAIKAAKLAAEKRRKEEEAKALKDSEKNKSKTTKKSTKTKKKEEKKEYDMELTPEARILSNSFSDHNGKLMWPVQRGNIAQHFGKQAHPVLKGVYVDNLGVEIQTFKEESVRAVFRGTVITVAEVPGMNKVVMIQHGDYFTVYAKLKTVDVETGAEVGAKQKIGTVYTDKDDASLLQFQIWKSNNKLNPEDWLIKK